MTTIDHGTPTIKNQITAWLAQHLTMPLARHMFQTYGDAAPRETTFALAYDTEPDARDDHIQLADQYVTIFEDRPIQMYKEIPYPIAGGKISGLDHNHFVLSVLIDIGTRFFLTGNPLMHSIGKRAFDTAWAHYDSYMKQKNSYLALKAPKPFGHSGRTRIAACALRSHVDLGRAAAKFGVLGHAAFFSTMVDKTLDAIEGAWPMTDAPDGPDGDHANYEHFSVFEVGALQNQLEWLAGGPCTEQQRSRALALSAKIAVILVDALILSETGNVIGIPYDISHPFDPAALVHPSNGVEPWAYFGLPITGKWFVAEKNIKQSIAFKKKFFGV